MYSELTALDASWFTSQGRTLRKLPSHNASTTIKMEMNTVINPQLCDISCSLSGNLDLWGRFPGYTKISERASRQTLLVYEVPDTFILHMIA